MSHATRPPPSPLSRFIGREPDLARLDEALADGAVVSIVGGAGIGKTRLAQEWLRARRATPGAEHVIDLAEARSLVDVVQPILSSIDATLPMDASDQAAVAALERALCDCAGEVFVLDNCEGCRGVLADVMTGAVAGGGVRVIVTSRIRLGIEGERVVALEPLALDTHAPELLVDRARALGQELDPDAPAVRALAEELEGVPLAIELAAARTRVLGAPELLERVRASKLDVLRRPIAPDDSLRARYEWSWELLTREEADALTALAAFARAFDVPAAEAVVGARGLDVLQSLREHNVVRDAGPDRYALYDGLRELALVRGAAEVRAAAERRHGAHFAGRSRALVAALRGRGARAAFDELAAAEGDLRLAVDRAVRRKDAALAADAFEGLAAVRQRRGPALDVVALGLAVADVVAVDDAASARVAAAHGYLVAEIDPRRSLELFARAVTRATAAGLDEIELFARAQIAVLSTRVADHEGAERAATALLDDPHASAQELARAFYVLAIVESSRDAIDEPRLRRTMGSALEQAVRSGDPSLLARTELVNAMIEYKLGTGERSLQALERARARCVDAGDAVAACIASMTRASALVESLPFDDAIAQLGSAIEEATRLGMVTLAAHGLWQRALLRLSAGHVALAESDLLESAAGLASSPMIAVCSAARACVRAVAGDHAAARAILEALTLDGAGFDSAHVVASAARALLGDGPAGSATSAARGPRVAHVLAAKLLALPPDAPPETITCADDAFTVEGTTVRLAGKPRLARLYRALVDARAADRRAVRSARRPRRRRVGRREDAEERRREPAQRRSLLAPASRASARVRCARTPHSAARAGGPDRRELSSS